MKIILKGRNLNLGIATEVDKTDSKISDSICVPIALSNCPQNDYPEHCACFNVNQQGICGCYGICIID